MTQTDASPHIPDAARASAGELAPGPPTKRVRLLVALSAAALLAATLGGLFAGTLGDKVYGAQVDILFQPPDSVTEIERQLVTQQTLLSSDAVLEPVAADAGIELSALRERQSVSLMTNSQVLRITVGGETPQAAVALAERIAEAYLEHLGDAAPMALGDGWIISGPEALDSPLHPRPIRSAALGAFAGLVVAACGLFAAGGLHRRA